MSPDAVDTTGVTAGPTDSTVAKPGDSLRTRLYHGTTTSSVAARSASPSPASSWPSACSAW
jgi:hypothetical protein